LPNTRRERNPLRLREEEDTTANKKVSEDKRNLFSKRKLRPLRRLPSD